MSAEFDYGPKRPDGQHGRHPTEQVGAFVAPIRNSYKHLACGTVTTCGDAIAITYAKHPSYYGGTFCMGCHDYFPLQRLLSGEEKAAEGYQAEEQIATAAFVWDVDGRPVGGSSDEDRAEAGKDKRSERGRQVVQKDGSLSVVAPRRHQRPAMADPKEPLPDPFAEEDL